MKNLYIALFLILSSISYSQTSCPGLDSLNYGNKWYHTVQIGSQCWLKENLNVGTEINGNVTQIDNNILEKYCYNDSISNCTEYGALYQWDEAMQYDATLGGKDICPDGWHIPHETEFMTLINYVGYSGNALKKIGQGSGDGAGTNTSGFSGMLVGINNSAGFSALGIWGPTWSSSSTGIRATFMDLSYDNNGIYYHPDYTDVSKGIRCLKNNVGSLLLQSPNGGEKFAINSQQNISWSFNNVSNVRIEFTTNDGKSWIQIIESTPASNRQFTWTIPNSGSNTCRVRVGDLGNSNTISQSSNVFTIIQPDSQICPGVTTVDYGGQIYNTIKIGSQCWFKENLNVGIMIPGSQDQTNNSILEKYCYNNSTEYCNKNGGLYQWNEAMQYSISEGVKGICPAGWHIPNSSEYSILRTTVGEDGNSIKAIGEGYGNGIGTDSRGFTGLLSGSRTMVGTFFSLDIQGLFWSSTKNNLGNADYLGLINYDNTIYQSGFSNDFSLGLSIRCLKDNDGSLTLTSPIGGEHWQAESIHNITWTDTNITHVKIELSTNNGTDWIKIIEATPAAAGSYNWKVSNVTSSNCIVKISDIGNMNNISKSNSVFTILPPPVMSCPGIPIVNYGGQIYNTVKIGSQCWLKENLNIGKIVSLNQNQTNNDTLERYCYNDDTANCRIYGGLYLWREAVQYTLQSLNRGICPVGWQIPSETDFSTLNSAVNGDGSTLKLVGQGDATNLSGFSALLLGSNASFWDTYNYLPYVGNNGSYGLSAGGLLLRTDASIQIMNRPSSFDIHDPISVRCIKDSLSLFLLSPYGGEKWLVGSKHKISWGGNLTDKKIKIEYSTNNGLSWFQIIDSTPAINGDYNWTIPNTPAVSKVRITDLNNPNSFSITNNVGIYVNLCPADSIIHFGDHNYHTIPLAGRCWFKENVNEGIRIQGILEQTNNGILEKYCYNDDTANCTTYGGLYKTTETGEPGICPAGWHTPNYNAFEDLLSDVLNDGNALKAIGQGSGAGAGTNSSGFSLLLAGTRNYDGTFSGLGYQTWIQHIFGVVATYEEMYIRDDYQNVLVGSVRCMRDEALAVITPYGGEFRQVYWQVGTVHKITWSYSNVQNIKIDYSIDGGLNWINIISSIPVTDSSYNWTIPNTPSKNCIVRISDNANPGIIGMTNGVFTIFPAISDPCNGAKTINYGGRIYNTVAIGGVCWFKENLNIGTMILSPNSQTNNGMIEKYCYNNDTAICNKYGGLYQWNEAMQYSTATDAQGICPPNWFIPTNTEFTGILDGYDGNDLRDITTGGGTNTSGFSALMAGMLYTDAYFYELGVTTDFWSSSQYYNSANPYHIKLQINSNYIGVLDDMVSYGFSVRCMHDYMNNVPVEFTTTEIAPPTKFGLSNAYPNPWNPTTTIRYQVPINTLVTIKLFDALGREVLTLENATKPAGNYEVTLNGKNLSSGVYYYQMKSGNFIETKKIVLLK